MRIQINAIRWRLPKNIRRIESQEKATVAREKVGEGTKLIFYRLQMFVARGKSQIGDVSALLPPDVYNIW